MASMAAKTASIFSSAARHSAQDSRCAESFSRPRRAPSWNAINSSSFGCSIFLFPFWGFVSTKPPLFHSHRSGGLPAFGKRFESHAQFLHCAKDCVFCSGGAGLQNRCDFLDAAAIPMAHDNSGALRGRELLKGLLHSKSKL